MGTAKDADPVSYILVLPDFTWEERKLTWSLWELDAGINRSTLSDRYLTAPANDWWFTSYSKQMIKSEISYFWSLYTFLLWQQRFSFDPSESNPNGIHYDSEL